MEAMKFPEKLDHEIARSGKSQTAIARRSGVSQSAISAMTRGERRPFMDQALRIARALGISLDYLADDDLDEPPAPPLTEDERAVLEIYHALDLDRREAIKRLAGAPEPAREPGPWSWAQPQRTETEADMQREREQTAPKKVERKKNSEAEKK